MVRRTIAGADHSHGFNIGRRLRVLDQWILKDVRELKSKKIQTQADLATLDMQKVKKEREAIQTTIDSLNNKAKEDSIAIANARAKARQDSAKAQQRLDKANKKVAALNREQKNIAANLAAARDTTEATSALTAARFPRLGEPAVLKNAVKQYLFIDKEGFCDKRLNPDGKGIANEYEKKVVKGATVIYDAATKLTWQGGYIPRKTWKNAKAYVKRLNDSTYAGFDDWRLPTLKEAMSLLEPENVDGSYVDANFKDTPYIWTRDEYAWHADGAASIAWFVSFSNGICDLSHVNRDDYVRAVR